MRSYPSHPPAYAPDEGLTDKQIEEMSLAEIEDTELKRMEYNAFKVCDDLTCRIDGAPVPNGYMKSYTSQKNEELFFSNHQRMKEFLGATEKERVCARMPLFQKSS